MTLFAEYGQILIILACIFGLFMAWGVGANDVANAVGPLAGINESIVGGAIAAKASIQLWVMAVGAIGIALGLAVLYIVASVLVGEIPLSVKFLSFL